MKDNRYLEQAAALLNKAKEADEVMSFVLVTSGYKSCLKTSGSGVSMINTLMGLFGKVDSLDTAFAVVVAGAIISSEDFRSMLSALLSDPEKLKALLKIASDELDAEIAECKVRREASGDEMEKEESHDSEEAA